MLYWRKKTTHPNPSTSRKVLRYAALLAIGCVVCVAMLEVEGRLLFGPNRMSSQMDEVVADPDCLYTFTPGMTLSWSMRVGPAETKVVHFGFSQQGLRDREYGPKQGNEFRILLLGDSFTMSPGLKVGQAISRCLEQLFERDGLRKHVTVINAGFGGYGPWQERVMLERRGFPVEPDLVVLQLFLFNDINDTLIRRGKNLRSYDEGNVRWERTLLPSMAWERRLSLFLYRNSKIYYEMANRASEPNLLGELVERLPFFPTGLPPLKPSEKRKHQCEILLRGWYPELQEGWQSMQQDVMGIQSDCAARGIDFLVYSMPWKFLDRNVWDEEVVRQASSPDQYEFGKDIAIARDFFARAAFDILVLDGEPQSEFQVSGFRFQAFQTTAET